MHCNGRQPMLTVPCMLPSLPLLPLPLLTIRRLAASPLRAAVLTYFQQGPSLLRKAGPALIALAAVDGRRGRGHDAAVAAVATCCSDLLRAGLIPEPEQQTSVGAGMVLLFLLTGEYLEA